MAGNSVALPHAFGTTSFIARTESVILFSAKVAEVSPAYLIPEFPVAAVALASALAVSLFILKRRKK